MAVIYPKFARNSFNFRYFTKWIAVRHRQMARDLCERQADGHTAAAQAAACAH
ncbi:MAG: hypothetical protein RIQ97_789, partial [Pseudomonadota bacterium]